LYVGASRVPLPDTLPDYRADLTVGGLLIPIAASCGVCAVVFRSKIGLRLSEIAEGLAVTPATASEAVSSLVEKGLVQKAKSAQDKRAIALTLTEKGKQQAAQVSSWPDFLFDAVDELTEEEQVVFLKGLIKIIGKLQEQGRIPIAHMCVSCHFFQPNQYPDAQKPHHCAFVNVPFGDAQLQIDCPDHVPLDFV
jgi:DNA-binding MarR family transcriptional regulator